MPLPERRIAGDSLLTDREGRKCSVKRMAENNLWTIANLKLNLPESYCYDDARGHLEYTIEL